MSSQLYGPISSRSRAGLVIGPPYPTRTTGLIALLQRVIESDNVMSIYFIRKGHYIVADYVDKVTNKHRPTYPWQVSLFLRMAIFSADSQIKPHNCTFYSMLYALPRTSWPLENLD